MFEGFNQLFTDHLMDLVMTLFGQLTATPLMMAASGHGTWLTQIPGVHTGTVHIAAAVMVSTLLLATMWLAAVRLRRAKQTADGGVIPDRSLTLLNLFDIIADGLFAFTASILGEKHAARYFPLVGTIFLFVFTNNVFGLIPGALPATQNFNTSFSIGILVFIIYNYEGIRAVGIKQHIAHFFGPKLPWWCSLATLMIFAIELVSHALRPFTLGVRLMANMTGDHAVLSTFLGMTEGTWIPIPVIFYGLGLFVCFIQAFVFTLLTMIYIMLATAHDH